MTDHILAYDPGNRLIKAATNDHQADFDHLVARIDDGMAKTLITEGDTADLWRINNQYFIFGKRALRLGVYTAEGATRYRPEYYQIFLGRALWECYPKARKDITLYAGHPPRDRGFKDAIKSASTGLITVEHNNEKRVYRVRDCYNWYEPVGGIMMQMLTWNGKYKTKQYQSGDMLVIDIGGLTIDYIIVADGVPDYESARSYTERNIIDAVTSFERIMRDKYPEQFNTRNDTPQDRLYRAIHSNEYDAGGHGKIPCKAEVDYVCEEIVDSVEYFYRQFGGETLHYILLTGGGSGLLEQKIRNRMMINNKQRTGVHLAHTREEIHMANVLGAHKLAMFYHSEGMLK